MRPKWTEPRIENLIGFNEEIIFEASGRIEKKPPSGIGAIFYWISYIFVNYASLFVTARFINTAYIVITNERAIIMSNTNWKFPFWSFDLSYNHHNYIINNDKISSFNTFESKILWVISAKGFLIESDGSMSMIFNGVKKEQYENAHNLIKDNKLINKAN